METEIDKIDNNIENVKVLKRKVLKKEEKYKEDRIKLIKNLENMIGLDDENRGKFSYELDGNEELKIYLKEMLPEIKKMYRCSQWMYFKNKDENRDEIGLLKSILKTEKYGIINKQQNGEHNGIKKKYSCFYFIKDLDMSELLKIKR